MKTSLAPRRARPLRSGLDSLGALLEALDTFHQALAARRIEPPQRALLALWVARLLECRACQDEALRHAQRLRASPIEIGLAEQGRALHPRDAALLEFAREVVSFRGEVRAASFMRARASGIRDAEMAEAVAVCALTWLGHELRGTPSGTEHRAAREHTAGPENRAGSGERRRRRSRTAH